jgi:hypothetical protein
VVELTANGDADRVEARLREALDAHGLQLFARTDHSAGARKADVELDADGTHVGYLDSRELADRYALDGHEQTLERQTAVLTKLAAAAAG